MPDFEKPALRALREQVLVDMAGILYEIREISRETIFIDGTKIEANANKYTFVWKKEVTRNQSKRLEKAAAFVAACEEMYGIRIVQDGKVTLHHLKKLRKELYRIKEAEGITFVHGIGRRKSSLQKSIEDLEESLDKLTSTASMPSMSPGQPSTDTTALIPFLKAMEEPLPFQYERIIADAGYESEENYFAIVGNGQIVYIKPQNNEKAKTRKYKKDIGSLKDAFFSMGCDSKQKF